ncbi:hypothetical protein MUP77_17195 [Candidatus Bathyarchaeota archaeon]|nr:hypothetical protein [Candidatus Bathyarchaeota archaeon]
MTKEPCYVVMQIKARSGTYIVGVLPEAPKKSYKHDIVSLGISKGNMTKSLLVMTPKEAVMFGVSLIRASILADIRISRNDPKDANWATNWESAFVIPDDQSGKP